MSWRLRYLSAALCLGVGASLSLHVLRPDPPTLEDIVVAAHDIAPGTPLSHRDVEIRSVPSTVVPTGAIRHENQVIGHRLAVSVPEGLPLVSSLYGGHTSQHTPEGRVVVAIRIDPAMAQLLHPGDTVDLLTSLPPSPTPTSEGSASSPVTYLAKSARIVPMPESHDADILGSSQRDGIILVAVSLTEAEQCAAVTPSATITPVLVRDQ